MNQLGISTTAGKLFWLSLIGYSAAFAGFYTLTQHTQARIAAEESSGVFAAFKQTACNHQSSCEDFTLTNTFDPAQKKLITKLAMPYQQKKLISEAKLQQDYSALFTALPWYIKRQFAGMLQINVTYNTPTTTIDSSKSQVKKHKK